MIERDRFGLGWRPEYAASLLARFDRIDLVEVLIEPALRLDRRGRDALRTLARTIPLHLHGTGLGLASTEAVEPRRLAAAARLVDDLEPDGWSEHLAFVRAGGREIGHLAGPPRTHAILDGLARNVASARRAAGVAPALENVASLVEPPGAEFDEAEGLSVVPAAAETDLLLDLHNLHANATNFAFDPCVVLDALPWSRIGRIHLAGGSWIESADGRRLLDDHRHEVPDAVLTLLEESAVRAVRPIAVVLEQDGDFPAFERLLARLDDARAAAARGRSRRSARTGVSGMPTVSATGIAVASRGPDAVSSSGNASSRAPDSPQLVGLASLYLDADVRARFLADPAREGARLGLGPGPFDLVGIAFAARSFASKRAALRPHRP